MTINQTTYQPISIISAPKIHTDLLWDLSFLFIGLAAVYFIFVFFYRNLLTAKAEREKRRKRELSPMISEFLFYEEEASKGEKSNYVNLKIEIRQLLKDDFNRKILAEVLLDLRKDLAGDTQKRLFRLYKDLGLHNDAFEKLKSWRWEVVAKAILDLTQMNVVEAYSFVTKFINDKRKTIRKQAEIAVVTLKPEGINYFLDTTTYKISEWQQLKLLDVLRDDESYQPPRFKAWLTSTNRHVVLFALRLIKFYNQNDASTALIELVKHRNNQIKEEAIGCLKEFYIISALPVLKLVFWKSSTDVKISILDAIGVLGSETDIEFLRTIEKKESNFSVRSKAQSSINVISPDTIMPTKGLLKTGAYTIPEDIQSEDVIDETSADTIVPENIAIDSSEKEAENIQTEEVIEETITDKAIQNITVIDSIEIKAEDMKKEDMSKREAIEPTTPVNKETETENNTSNPFSLDFIPLVIHEEATKENQSTIDQIEVEAEEVLAFDKNDTIINSLDELTEEEIAFLPIVVDTIEVPVSTNEGDTSEKVVLDEIEVIFDEIQLNTQETPPTKSPSYSKYETTEIFDIKVTYEEFQEPATADTTDPDFRLTDKAITREETSEIIVSANTSFIQSTENMVPQDHKNLKRALRELIDFDANESPEINEEVSGENPLLDFGNEFIDSSIVFENQSKADDSAKDDLPKTTEEVVDKKSPKEEITIPHAILSDDLLEEIVMFKENTEESRMQLLDDIAELGDEREIPLLKELLINEKYRTVKDRINRLIEIFSASVEKPAAAEPIFKPFNVFEDLFRTCDTEAKLILMNEIVAVGDEAEIDFLTELLDDPEEAISNKAAKILDQLKAKLALTDQPSSKKQSNSNEGLSDDKSQSFEAQVSAEYDSLLENLEIAPAEEDIFEVDFELSEPLVTVNEKLAEEASSSSNKNQVSFLNHICSFSNKIRNRFNG